MTEPQPQPPPPPPPPVVYQTPDWETPTRPPRTSFLDRIKDLARRGKEATWAAPFAHGRSQQHASTKETERVDPISSPPPPPPTRSPLQRRLDAVLPPHRTYMGRSRRFLLLCLAALLLVLVLVLAIGLGVGLSRRNKNHQPKNLPLPSNHGVFTGDLTYYQPGLGACGTTSGAGDAIAAVSHFTFDAAAANSGSSTNPNANPLCGRKIRIQRDYAEGGSPPGNRSVDITVVDRCTGCQPTDLDVSLSVFTQLAPEDSGRVLMSWAWLE